MTGNEHPIVLQAPFGALGVRMAGQAVVSIAFLPVGTLAGCLSDPAAVRVHAQIEAYLCDPRSALKFPIRLQGTGFQRRVWKALQGIPPGQTRTYGELARALGTSPRAVGGACRANPLALAIPCHRAVARDGLGGFAGCRAGPLLEAKRWLLRHEGAARTQARHPESDGRPATLEAPACGPTSRDVRSP